MCYKINTRDLENDFEDFKQKIKSEFDKHCENLPPESEYQWLKMWSHSHDVVIFYTYFYMTLTSLISFLLCTSAQYRDSIQLYGLRNTICFSLCFICFQCASIYPLISGPSVMRTFTLSLKTLTTSVSRLFVNYCCMFVIRGGSSQGALGARAPPLCLSTCS